MSCKFRSCEKGIPAESENEGRPGGNNLLFSVSDWWLGGYVWDWQNGDREVVFGGSCIIWSMRFLRVLEKLWRNAREWAIIIFYRNCLRQIVKGPKFGPLSTVYIIWNLKVIISPYFFFLEKYIAIPAQPSATTIKAMNAINKKPVAIFYPPVFIFYDKPYRLPFRLRSVWCVNSQWNFLIAAIIS